MSMMTLKCPKCGAEAKLSLADTSYTGPRRCWKCHEFFTITIYNNRVTSCEPLSKEDYERQQEAKKAAEKSRGGGIGFSRQEQLQFPQNPPEKPQSGIDSSKQEDIDIFKILAGKSGGGIDFSKQAHPESPSKAPEKPQRSVDFVKHDEPAIPQKPPEKRQDFIRPVNPKKPSKQTETTKPGSVYPPERFQTFVPQEDIHEEPQKTQKPKNTPEKQRDYTKHLSRIEPDGSAIFPPDRIQTFVPLEDIEEEPKKPQKPKLPPGKV